MDTFDPPTVLSTEYCIVQTNGVTCGEPTGCTEPGVDADLCPEHRAQMAKQREENNGSRSDGGSSEENAGIEG